MSSFCASELGNSDNKSLVFLTKTSFSLYVSTVLISSISSKISFIWAILSSISFFLCSIISASSFFALSDFSLIFFHLFCTISFNFFLNLVCHSVLR